MIHLRELLRCEEERVFNSALDQLSSVPKSVAIQLLEEMAFEPDGTLRSRAIDGMARVSSEQAEALALRLLGDPAWYVRVTAIDSLRKLGSDGAAPRIARLLTTDPDEYVRSWAAFALGCVGDASVIPVLEAAAEYDTGADHEGVPIRHTAVKSIEEIRLRLANP
jgi:HEAT repeat protein